MSLFTTLTRGVAVTATTVTLAACASDTTAPSAAPADEGGSIMTAHANGNGFPSGAHFTLNIIGVPKDKSADMNGNNGHRIFVDLVGNTRIDLSMGDYKVLDANGTDGYAAFQLPNPDPENDGITEYSVYARALGKPGGSSTTTTCFDDAQTGDTWCSVYSMVLVREKGKSWADNVSRELLYVYADTNNDGTLERYPLFSDALDDYFWSYDNYGLRVAQLRFYEISTNVN